MEGDVGVPLLGFAGFEEFTPPEELRLEGRTTTMKRQYGHIGVDHPASTKRSILWKRAILGSIVLVFAATPILTAVGFYSSIDWISGGSCGGIVVLDPQCGTPSEKAAGFIAILILFCTALAALYWLIGSIIYVVLRAITPKAGRTALAGMAIGSGVAAITLLVSSVASYFFIDWERHYWERELFASYSAQSVREAAQSVREAIDAGVDINVKRDDGGTPLHAAAGSGNLTVIQALLDAGADVHAKDDDGETPLHAAAAFGRSPRVIQALLDAGADVHAKDDDGETPLHAAAAFGRSPRVIQALLDAGADVHAKSNEIDNPSMYSSHLRGGGETPLHKAARGSDRDLAALEALLHAGADTNAKNDRGETPLHVAAWYGYKNLAVIQALLDAGADVHAKDDDGRTPLHAAAERENLTVIQALLDAGADIEAKSNEIDHPSMPSMYSPRLRGETPLHKAVRGSDRDLAVLEALLHAGADINAKNDRGKTPLHVAAGYGYKNLAVIALLDAGADVHAKDVDGRTPLHAAAEQENLTVIQALLDAGADINAKTLYGETPLDLAKFRGNSATVTLLQKASGS